MKKDEPDIFADALASHLDAIRRAAFDQAIAILRALMNAEFDNLENAALRAAILSLEAARDQTEKPRSDKGKHHHVAGVLQEDEAEN